MDVAASDSFSNTRRLLFVAVSAVTAVALSYSELAENGTLNLFLAVVGAGLLLALLVAVPALWFGRAER